MVKKYINPEELKKVKELDILTYFQNYDPSSLVKIARNTYCTKDHDSLKISNGMWHWFSHQIGGRTALDYLIKVEEYNFIDAALYLKELINNNPPDIVEKYYDVKKDFKIPPKSKDSTVICDYLLKRCITPNVIGYCILNDYIYQNANNKHIVFLGKDQDKKIQYVYCRGTSENTFHQEIEGSDKRYSFCLHLNPESNEVHVFESAIDALSLASLNELQNKDWKSHNYLSLGGVYVKSSNGDYSPPVALIQYLEMNPFTEKIILHLDNDRIGRDATKWIQEWYDLEVIDDKPLYKDVNEDLIHFTKGQKKMNTKTYNVIVTETLERVIEVQSTSKDEAIAKVEKDWKDQKCILDPDDFTGVKFDAHVKRTKELSR